MEIPVTLDEWKPEGRGPEILFLQSRNLKSLGIHLTSRILIKAFTYL